MLKQAIAFAVVLFFSCSASASIGFLDRDHSAYSGKSSGGKSHKKTQYRTKYSRKKSSKSKYGKRKPAKGKYTKGKSGKSKHAKGKYAQKKQPAKKVATTRVKRSGTGKRASMSSLDCMARNIYFEAGIESQKGKIAVANVTINRVRSKHYPKSVCSVVYQKSRTNCAFSWTCDRKSNTPPKNRTYKESVQIARLALSGALKDVTGVSDHYHATYVKPKWRKSMEQKGKIGQHIFYKRYSG